MARALVIVLLSVLSGAFAAFAHEMRPAYLELTERAPGEFTVLWKTPMVGNARLALSPEISGDTTMIAPIATRTPPGAAVQTWVLRAPALRGATLRIRGLDGTMTDALVRLEFLDGSRLLQRLTPQQPSLVIPKRQSSGDVALVYLRLGVEHILAGVDHLLFVLGLLLLVPDLWMLTKTITAFTVAHSITLAGATLGYVHLPVVPIEATIALSILFLGCEIARSWRDKGGAHAMTRPWLVAFSFGLLHGFGFSTALVTAGLPRVDLPFALFSFNVGVELGQIAFVAGVLAMAAALRSLGIAWPVWVRRAPGYLVGSLGAYWTLERTIAIFLAAR